MSLSRNAESPRAGADVRPRRCGGGVYPGQRRPAVGVRPDIGPGRYVFRNRLRDASALDSDKIRLIAVATEKRLDAAPNIPTVAESYPGFSFSSFNGFFVPSGTPDDIVDALRSAVAEVAKSPAVSKRLEPRHRAWRVEHREMLATLKGDRQHFEQASKAAGLRK